MDLTAQLDGSDAQGRHASTQAQRISSFINQLGDALLILDSLDSPSLDQLKQDEGCKDLVRRLLSTFPIVPLSNVASQIDQVVKAGLEGIAANIARLSLPDSSPREAESRTKRANPPAPLSSPPGTSPATPGDGTTVATSSKSLPAAAVKLGTVPARKSPASIKDDPDTVATIHFLRGGSPYHFSTVICGIESRLSKAEGRKYTVRESDQGSSPNEYLSLTSSPSTTSFSSMIKDLERDLSNYWTPGTITYIRSGGEVEYGITIADLRTKAPFVEGFALIRDQINRDYLRVQSQWFGMVDIGVSTTLAAGVYLLSGDVGRLEKLVSEGEKILTPTVSTVNSQGKPRTNRHRAVIRPFCLRDRDDQ